MGCEQQAVACVRHAQVNWPPITGASLVGVVIGGGVALWYSLGHTVAVNASVTWSTPE